MEVLMFDNSEKLKEFILWAKSQRIETVKIGEIEVRFSNLAFIDDLASLEQELTAPVSAKTEERNTSKTLVDTLSTDDDEELLTWSSRP